MKHFLIASLVFFATIVWNVECETDMYDDSSIVKTEETEEVTSCESGNLVNMSYNFNDHQTMNITISLPPMSFLSGALNEVWMVCSSCEEECGKPPQPCPRICQPARCQCPAHKGYRRNSKGECVFCHDSVPKL
ncbi:hypothetical protein B9Z55_005366 [Caenorhabditis nigoni]|uniref:Uncharacterized protein n=1 Tax=Caenorhabditis nigoni TaxID=1611254 RepID=A0A2G5V0Z3_9PELO|nr:hypothetical protein B9Z55_005366 [Caenorhabditis nigoni]